MLLKTNISTEMWVFTEIGQEDTALLSRVTPKEGRGRGRKWVS